ncbi:hypothetical protein IPJ91_03085 [bacterium]|nr:MAG: hypothetical protein IPJ91_03085 [bacterium]
MFQQNPEFDLKATLDLLKNDPSGVDSRLKSMNAPVDIFDEKKGKIDSTKLSAYFLKTYTECQQILENNVPKYLKAWNKINDKFFNRLNSIINLDWPHNDYIVNLSPITEGISEFKDNQIITIGLAEPAYQMRITAHELTMIFIWHYLFRNFPESNEYAKPDIWYKYWGVNEVITNALLGLDSELNSLWTDESKGDDFLLNYPQLTELKSLVREKYNKSSFEELVRFAVANQTHVQADK